MVVVDQFILMPLIYDNNDYKQYLHNTYLFHVNDRIGDASVDYMSPVPVSVPSHVTDSYLSIINEHHSLEGNLS